MTGRHQQGRRVHLERMRGGPPQVAQPTSQAERAECSTRLGLPNHAEGQGSIAALDQFLDWGFQIGMAKHSKGEVLQKFYSAFYSAVAPPAVHTRVPVDSIRDSPKSWTK